MPKKRSRSIREEEESDEENAKVPNRVDSDEDEADEDDDVVMKFSSQAPELTQDIPEVKDSERSNLMSLPESKREKAITDLARIVFFKALVYEPIDRSKCVKEAGLNDARIASAAFDEVNIRLKNCFGFELKRIPLWMEKWKSVSKGLKDRYFLSNPLLAIENGKYCKDLHAVHDGAVVEKGLLQTILALTYCKGERRSDGSRWIQDNILYGLLHHIDDSIPAEPPATGSKRVKSSSTQLFVTVSEVNPTPNVDALLTRFVHRDYLLKEKAGQGQMDAGAEEGTAFYSMGPRAAIEIGRRQIIYFCAELLDEEPDQQMLQELEAFENEEEEEV